MIKGTICAVITPIEKERIDRDSFKNILDFLKKEMDGVLVCGTTGEFPLLSFNEKKTLFKIALEEKSERFEVIPHIGGNNLEECLKLAKFCKEQGASVIAAITPYYYKWSFTSVFNYYRQIEKVELPILLYEIPKYTGLCLSLKELKEIISCLNIKALKESTTEKRRLRNVSKLQEKITLLVGTDSLIDYGLRIGYKGCVSTLANVFPGIVKKIYKFSKVKNWKKARVYQKKLNKIREVFKKYGAIRAVKKVLERKGLCKAEMKKPFEQFSGAEEKKFLEELDRALEK